MSVSFPFFFPFLKSTVPEINGFFSTEFIRR